jgi:hypothetical protein
MALSWDGFDSLGNEHYRLMRSAERHIKNGYKKFNEAKSDQEREEIRKTIEAWSLTHSRHSRRILQLLQMEYQAAKDLYGHEGWQMIHNPAEEEKERKTKEEAREWLRIMRRRLYEQVMTEHSHLRSQVRGRGARRRR